MTSTTNASTIHVTSTTTQRSNYSFTVNESSDSMQKFQYVYDICTNVAQGCILGLTIYLIILCIIHPIVLFTWHPFFYTIGWVFLAMEGILVFSSSNYITRSFSTSNQVRLHWMIQTGAGCCMFLGFLMVFINKINNDFSHFNSSHAKWGLATNLLTVVGIAVGTYSYVKKFIVYKFIHVCFSILVLITGTVTLLNAFATHWFQSRGGTFMQIICTIITIFVFLVIIIRPCFSTFKRFKYLIK